MSTIQDRAPQTSDVNPNPSVEGNGRDGYRVHFHIIHEDDGTFSAVALNLPGAGSCGATADETFENAKEAARGVLESYIADGEAIPWKDTSAVKIPDGDEQTWVTVHATAHDRMRY